MSQENTRAATPHPTFDRFTVYVNLKALGVIETALFHWCDSVSRGAEKHPFDNPL
jgi:hypothetical protein